VIRLRRLTRSVALAALLLILAEESSNAANVLVDRLPVSLYLVVLGIGVVAAVLQVSNQSTRIPWPLIGAWTCFVFALLLSHQQSSLSPAAGSEAVVEGLKDLVFLVTCCVLAANLKQWWMAAAAICGPMAIISALSAANEWLFANRLNFFGFAPVTDSSGVGVLTARHAGPMPDPNFWGRLLVVGLAFALALVFDCLKRRQRGGIIASCGVVGLLLVGIYLTGSRGTFLAAAVAVFLYLLLVGVSLRRLLIGMPLVGFGLFLVPGVASRLLSTAGLAEQGQRAAVDSSLLERIATQQVGLIIFQDRPLTGVGPEGFIEAFPKYASMTDLTLLRVTAPHNLYLGLSAEVGLIGLAAWLLVIGVALLLGVRAIRQLSVLPDTLAGPLRPYVAAGLAALVAWSAASAFLHLSYVRVLLIVVALICVLEWQTRETVRSLGLVTSGRRVRAAKDILGGSGASMVVAGVLGALLATGLVVAAPRDIEARTVGVLNPVRDENYSYYLDLRSREGVVPTFAVTVAASGDRVEAQGDPTSGLITVTADGASGAARVRAATILGSQQLERIGLGRLYQISWGEVTESTAGAPWLPAAVAGAAGGVSGGMALYLYRRLRQRNRPNWLAERRR